jgi:hypothetical protein
MDIVCGGGRSTRGGMSSRNGGERSQVMFRKGVPSSGMSRKASRANSDMLR